MRSFTFVSVLVSGVMFLTLPTYAWTGPTQLPPPNVPDGNVSAPINVGSIEQLKSGVLGVNGLAVFGNTLLSGASRYLNFGTIPTPSDSSTGYGIRDNAGTLEFKNSGGLWASLNTMIQNYLSIGAVTEIRFLDGTTQLTAATAPQSGVIVKSVYAEYGTVTALNTIIPRDNTIPQSTEGTQVLSVTITPTSASNKLRIRFNGVFSTGGTAGQSTIVAVFRNSGSGAIATTYGLTGVSGSTPAGTQISLVHEEVAGVITPITYYVRAGPNGSGVSYFNGAPGYTGNFGGTMKSTITVEEITP